MKGIQVQEMITFVGTPTAEKGVIHCVGKGVVMASEGEQENQKWQHTQARE